MTQPAPQYPPSTADFERLAREAVSRIPETLRRHCANVVVRVTDFPDDAVIEEMGLETPFDLLGLYTGISLVERSVDDVAREPDLIDLYRRPILDYWCETDESLYDVVRNIIIHEIGHHFGFSDADMEAIEGATGGDRRH